MAVIALLLLSSGSNNMDLNGSLVGPNGVGVAQAYKLSVRDSDNNLADASEKEDAASDDKADQ